MSLAVYSACPRRRRRRVQQGGDAGGTSTSPSVSGAGGDYVVTFWTDKSAAVSMDRPARWSA